MSSFASFGSADRPTRQIERMLDQALFIRVHRSVIVKIDRIRELHREADGGGSLVLKNGVALRVARSVGSPRARSGSVAARLIALGGRVLWHTSAQAVLDTPRPRRRADLLEDS